MAKDESENEKPDIEEYPDIEKMGYGPRTGVRRRSI